VRVVSGQHLKFNAANGQSLKISVVNGQNAKRAGQIFDLAVAAVTIESMGVTPPRVLLQFVAYVIHLITIDLGLQTD